MAVCSSYSDQFHVTGSAVPTDPEKAVIGRNNFSRKARIYQALGVTGMIASAIPFYLIGPEYTIIRVSILFAFLLSFLELYVRLGGALFGPHQFIFGYVELFKSLFGNREAGE
ncbi:MAG: hypothetical protein AAF456_14620 [Planctomycetota bacterium]